MISLPENLRARIFAVKLRKQEPSSRNKKSIYNEDLSKLNEETEVSDSDLDHPNQPVFVDVGLIGNTEMSLENGMCIFSGIKFRTTSFNHEGSLFFLAIVIYQSGDSDSMAVDKGVPKVELPSPNHPKVLFSKISPPVLVNSRKINSRDIVKKNNLKSLFMPFDLN